MVPEDLRANDSKGAGQYDVVFRTGKGTELSFEVDDDFLTELITIAHVFSN